MQSIRLLGENEGWMGGTFEGSRKWRERCFASIGTSPIFDSSIIYSPYADENASISSVGFEAISYRKKKDRRNGLHHI